MDAISRLIAKNQLKSSQLLRKSQADAKTKGTQTQVDVQPHVGRTQGSSGQIGVEDFKQLLRAEFQGMDLTQHSHSDARQIVLKRAVRLLLKAELKLLQNADSDYLDACVDDVYRALCIEPAWMDELFFQISKL